MSEFEISVQNSDRIHDVQFDSYGQNLASCFADGTIRVFSVSAEPTAGKQPTLTSVLTGHIGPVWQVSWAPPAFGAMLASASFDRTIKVWQRNNVGAWNPIHTVTSVDSSVNSVSWGPASFGLIFAAGAADGKLSLTRWDDRGSVWQTAFSPLAHRMGVMSVAWQPAPDGASSDGTHPLVLASGGCDGNAYVWKVTAADGSPLLPGPLPELTWTKIATLAPSSRGEWVRAVAFSPAAWSGVLAVGGNSGVLRIFEGEGPSYKEVASIGTSGAIHRLAWNALGASVSAAVADGSVVAVAQKADGDWEKQA